MTNAANARALKRKGVLDELARKTADDDMTWLMGDPRGRRFMWRMLGHTGVYSRVFNTHGGLMNFNEGRRDVGLFLLGEIDRLFPERFALMAAENAQKQQEEEESDD